jgi:protein-S-isoprenylcysteine O-methyltransferase Ste14
MHLVFDIFQGIGIAAAVGIRPFLPALAVGALAAGGVEIHFNGTDYSFLQQAPFLAAMAVAAVVLALAEHRFRPEQRLFAAALAIAGAALGALLFAGSLARGHYISWPGLIGGVLCAAVGVAATVPLLRRVRQRLDQGTAAALPFYAEAGALLFAVLSVLGPPIGVIGLAALIWLLFASRRREGQKYAGLRILR